MSDHMSRHGTSVGLVGTWGVALWEWAVRHGINDVTILCAVITTLVSLYTAIPKICDTSVWISVRVRRTWDRCRSNRRR